MPFQPTPAEGGALTRQKMLDAGAPQPQVDQWVSQQRQKMMDAGAPADQVNAYWGANPTNAQPVADALQSEIEPHTHTANNPWDDMVAGWQQGNIGIVQTQGKPTVTANPNGNLGDATLSTLGQLASDGPTAIAGAIGGAAIGAISGAGVGAVPGAIIGSAVLPATMREALLKSYNTTGPYDWHAASKDAFDIGWEGIKSGVAATIGMAVGGPAGEKAVEAGASPFVGWTVNTIAGATSATAAQAALEGHVPSANDFITGAIVAVGIGGAGHFIGEGAGRRFAPSPEGQQVVQNLQDMYQRTGITPAEATHLAATDEQVHQEIIRARSASGDQLTPTLDAYAARLGRQNGKSFGPEPTSPYEPLKEEPKQAEPTEEPTPGFMKPEQVPQVTLDVFHTLEGSADDAVSPAGAVGKYQIMPATARAYGFDPTQLKNPAYNERVARAVLADLSNRFKGNMADMMVAYNAGPRRATTWIRGGRDFYSLPLETQKYLLHGERIGAIDSGFTTRAAEADLAGDAAVQGGDIPRGEPQASPEPGNPAEGTEEEQPTDQPYTPKEAEDKVMSQVGTVEGPESWAEKLNLGRVWRGFQFALTPAHQFDVNKGTVGVKGTANENAVGTEDVARSTFGTSGQANQFYTKGPVDLRADENGAPVFTPTKGANFIDAYKLAGKRGGTMRGFAAYRLALRTLEKDEQGVNTGVDVDAARAVVNAPGNFEKYDAAHRMIHQAQDGIIDYSIASGMLSPERAQAMRALNDEYVSMNRLLDDKYVPPSFGRLFGVKQSYKKMEGSNRLIIPPEIAEMDNVNAQVRMATRNVAISYMIDQMRKIDPESVELVKISKNAAVKEVEDAKEALGREDGIELPEAVRDAIEPILTARELLANLRHERGLGNSDHEVVLFRNGEPEVWHVKDDALARMFKEVSGEPSDPLPGVLGAIARFSRNGITSAPTFLPRALWHATVASVSFNEGGSHVLFGNLYHGTMAALFGDKLGGFYKDAFDRYAANGGLGGTVNEVNRNMISEHLDTVMNGGENTSPLPAIVNAVRHAPEALRVMQHMLHNSAQVGSMIASERKGLPTLRAAMLARKGGLDYAERFVSPAVNAWATWTPFMPTGFKDFQQVTQAVADHPIATAAHVMTWLVAPTLLLTAANRLADQNLDPKDRYTNLPLWLRDNYWVTPPINGVRIKVPKPYVGGAIFATLPERLFNAAWDEAHADGRQAGHDMDNLFMGMLGRMAPPFMPTAIEPTLEQISNHNFYLNRPLVPDYLARQSGYMQYSANTSKTSIAVSKFLHDTLKGVGIGPVHLDQTSPTILDNYVAEWGGTLPSEFWHQLGDVASFQPEALKRGGITEAPGKEPEEPADNPFYGSFVVRHSNSGQVIDDYYNAAAEVDQAHADLSRAMKDRDQGEIVRARANPLLTLNLAGTTKALSNMRGFIDRINKSNASDEEKLHLTDQLSTQMFELANARVIQVDQLKK